jgi:antirestriction protein ArdC
MGHPSSLVTRKPYRGINPILLDLTALCGGLSGRWWATFNQWKEHGGSVKSGAKATWITLYKPIVKRTGKTDSNGNEEVDRYSLMRMFPVFCIDQVNGDSLDHLRPDPNGTNDGVADYATADAVIEKTGAKISHGGNSAHFATSGREISIPWKSKFDTEENYYTTLFHELSHWADHAIGSVMGKRFGDEDYFFGELVAEISACYLADACEIPAGKRWDDSVDYLGSWIDRMKRDNSWILKASYRASQVTEYILNFSRTEAEAKEAETATA